MPVSSTWSTKVLATLTASCPVSASATRRTSCGEAAEATAPQEVLLVADALTGQDAVNVAKSFVDQIDLTGIVLTRLDGDARGGAALSMRAVTGRPIKFAGVGEGIDKIEAFHPERVAGRILGMGDVVSLVERAQETIQVEEAEAMAAKMAKGQFDLNDLRAQLRQMERMGGLGALAGMLPGIGKMRNQINQSGVLEGNVLGRLDAIIGSMTPKERLKPDLLNAKRKIRVAKGSGTTVQEVNKLLKMHQEMANAMKKIRKMGGLGKLGALFGGGGGLGGALGGLPGGGLPPGGLPGLPGGNPPFNPRNFKK